MRIVSEPGKPKKFAAKRRCGLFAASLALVTAGLMLALGCAESSAGTDATAALEVARRAGHAAATPPFYRVSGGEGATLLVLGTIHLGPEAGWTLSPALESSIATADAIVLEIDLRKATDELVSTLIANIVLLDPPDTLRTVVRPETLRLLDEKDATLAAMGMPRRARERMKPWFVAVGLIESATAESGYPLHESIEGRIMQSLAGRPLIGLETFEFQLRLLDGLSPRLQDVMLLDTLNRLDDTKRGIEELIEAWRTGDETALIAIAREGVDELPELEGIYEVLLDQRNRTWLPHLRALLEDESRAGEEILVGVGALHVVGPGSVLALLREAGYRVTPIDPMRPRTKRGAPHE